MRNKILAVCGFALLIALVGFTVAHPVPTHQSSTVNGISYPNYGSKH